MARAALLLVLMLGACGPVPSAPPAATSPPERAADAPRLDADDLARRTHARINAARGAEGLPALAWDDSLVPLARAHSEDMARRDFFAHANPDGQDVNARATALDLSCEYSEGNTVYRGFGENLFQTFRFSGYATRQTAAGTRVRYDWRTPEQLAEQAVTEWLNSPGHRRNLLSAQYRSHAVGVAFGTEGRVYFTDVFC